MSITSGVIYPLDENELQVPKTTGFPKCYMAQNKPKNTGHVIHFKYNSKPGTIIIVLDIMLVVTYRAKGEVSNQERV